MSSRSRPRTIPTACSRYDGKMWSCGTHREAGPYLRRLLSEARDPERHLALALEVGPFQVEGASERHDAVEFAEFRIRQLLDEGKVLGRRLSLSTRAPAGESSCSVASV